jgi:hypothetical protein
VAGHGEGWVGQTVVESSKDRRATHVTESEQQAGHMAAESDEQGRPHSSREWGGLVGHAKENSGKRGKAKGQWLVRGGQAKRQ